LNNTTQTHNIANVTTVTPTVVPTVGDSLHQPTQLSVNCPNSVSINPTTGILLHHKDQSHYDLSQYCMPVQDSFVSSEQFPCKWGDHSCIVFKTNVTDRGQAIPSLSPSVFSSSPEDAKYSKYSIMDVRMAKCFYPNCVDRSKPKPKVFNHICYMNSLTLKTNLGFKMAVLDSTKDPFYGGTDKHGTTNATRREGYHQLLSMMIEKENGKFLFLENTCS
jgi:hypothetical protein